MASAASRSASEDVPVGVCRGADLGVTQQLDYNPERHAIRDLGHSALEPCLREHFWKSFSSRLPL